MLDLSGKTALVTGATGGIGSEISEVLYNQGANVLMTGTRAEVLDQLVSKLGTRAFGIPCNLRERESIELMLKKANDLIGPIDILVNNAGITKDGLLVRMKDEDIEEVISVNLFSAFRLCRMVLKGMMRRRFGRIISISSVVGFTGNVGQTNYVASKSGLVGLTKSLAKEVASREITVNCVAPGFIQTAMTDSLNNDQRASVLQNIPSGRFGKSLDIAYAVAYLASEEASYVNGQTLHVNGGMAMF